METGWKWQAHKDRNNLFEKQANRTAACGGPVVTGVVNCAEGFWGITPDCLSDCLPSRAGNGGLVGCYIVDAIVAIGKAGGGGLRGSVGTGGEGAPASDFDSAVAVTNNRCQWKLGRYLKRQDRGGPLVRCQWDWHDAHLFCWLFTFALNVCAQHSTAQHCELLCFEKHEPPRPPCFRLQDKLTRARRDTPRKVYQLIRIKKAKD